MSRNISFSRLDNCLPGGTAHDGNISPVFLFTTVRLILSMGVWSGSMSITPMIIQALPFRSVSMTCCRLLTLTYCCRAFNMRNWNICR